MLKSSEHKKWWGKAILIDTNFKDFSEVRSADPPILFFDWILRIGGHVLEGLLEVLRIVKGYLIMCDGWCVRLCVHEGVFMSVHCKNEPFQKFLSIYNWQNSQYQFHSYEYDKTNVFFINVSKDSF